MICTSQKMARNYSRRRVRRWKIHLGRRENPHFVAASLMVGGVFESGNVNVKVAPLRTFVTRTGRKQAMQVPPDSRPLGYTIPEEPRCSNSSASPCEAA